MTLHPRDPLLEHPANAYLRSRYEVPASAHLSSQGADDESALGNPYASCAGGAKPGTMSAQCLGFLRTTALLRSQSPVKAANCDMKGL